MIAGSVFERLFPHVAIRSLRFRVVEQAAVERVILSRRLSNPRGAGRLTGLEGVCEH